MSAPVLSPEALAALKGYTPGPWHVRFCDDELHMCMTAVSAVPVPPGNRDQYVDRDPSETVAIVYHQCIPFVRPEDDEGADANAALIAAAPALHATALALIAENARLQTTLGELTKAHENVVQAAVIAAKKADEENAKLRAGTARDATELLELLAAWGSKGVAVECFSVGDFRVERCKQREGEDQWAVRQFGNALSQTGEWAWEPMPSSRTEEWLRQFRFATSQDAINAAIAARET